MLHDLIQSVPLRPHNGVIYYYDSLKRKWLSVNRSVINLSLNHKRVGAGRWFCIDNTPTNNSGFRLPRDGTIIATSLQSSSESTLEIKLYKNGITPIHTLDSVSRGISIDTLDIDLQRDDWIGAQLVNGITDYPVLSIEIAWRLPN